jgi:hypothetical protein
VFFKKKMYKQVAFHGYQPKLGFIHPISVTLVDSMNRFFIFIFLSFCVQVGGGIPGFYFFFKLCKWMQVGRY